MKKSLLTVLGCATAILGSAQTLSTSPVSTFDELEDGAIYALKTVNDKATSGGWYYRNNNLFFTLNANGVAPGSKGTANKGGLVGTLTSKTITAGTTDYLVLGTKDGALGFYLPNAESTSIAANKAYFDLNGQPASAMGYAINFGMVTGIASAIINKQTNTDACYDLSGRRIASPVKSGLYISNGKKIIVK